MFYQGTIVWLLPLKFEKYEKNDSKNNGNSGKSFFKTITMDTLRSISMVVFFYLAIPYEVYGMIIAPYLDLFRFRFGQIWCFFMYNNLIFSIFS